MSQTIELPFEVIYDPYHYGAHFALRTDIVEWCSTELQDEYKIKFVRGDVKTKNGQVLTYSISFFGVFSNETDAVLFKLRWL
jgi:hypothetical protein